MEKHIVIKIRSWNVEMWYDDESWGNGTARWCGRGIHPRIMWSGVPFYFSPEYGLISTCEAWKDLLPKYLQNGILKEVGLV